MTKQGYDTIRLQTLVISAAILAVGSVIGLGIIARPVENTASQPFQATIGHDGVASPRVAVIDGDTIEIDGRIVDLAGIDAPELGQRCERGGHLTPCGLDAAFALRKLIAMADREPACVEAADTDAVPCRIGSLDPAETLLANGLAVALPNAPLHYRAAEQRAREVSLGIWRGRFVDPDEWRSGRRLAAETEALRAAEAATDWPRRIAGVTILPQPLTQRDPCLIKGVLSPTAERRYIGPLDAGYETIHVGPDGARRFCSDDEARAAGWSHGHLDPARRVAALH